MRTFIYKNEIECMFLQYRVHYLVKQAVISELFVDPFTSRSKQFQLKPEYSNVNQLDEALKRHITDGNTIGAIKTLFIVTDDLQLPAEVKQKILNNEPIAVFIGAGVSKTLDYPLWNELADMAIKFLLYKEKINHFEFDKLINEISDPKQKLSIFDKFCPRDDLGAEFYKKALKEREVKNKPNPYDIIASPNFGWLKLTSNVEYALCKAQYESHKYELRRESRRRGETNPPDDYSQFKKKTIINKDFCKASINSKNIYHLHGELDYIENTIFTTEDYIKHYFQNSDLRNFLKEIFEDYTVIFVGYGLEEFPILEAVIKDTGKTHYALMPTYLNEMNVFKIKEEYYDKLNISLFPYYIDFKGYGRLYEVLKHWEEDITKERDRSYLDNIDEIDEVL